MTTSYTKHVAREGARAGQWVDCNAKVQCRNGGKHISYQTLETVRLWVQKQGNGAYFPSKNVRMEHVEQFIKLSTEEQLQALTEYNEYRAQVRANYLAREDKAQEKRLAQRQARLSNMSANPAPSRIANPNPRTRNPEEALADPKNIVYRQGLLNGFNKDVEKLYSVPFGSEEYKKVEAEIMSKDWSSLKGFLPSGIKSYSNEATLNMYKYIVAGRYSGSEEYRTALKAIHYEKAKQASSYVQNGVQIPRTVSNPKIRQLEAIVAKFESANYDLRNITRTAKNVEKEYVGKREKTLKAEIKEDKKYKRQALGLSASIVDWYDDFKSGKGLPNIKEF